MPDVHTGPRPATARDLLFLRTPRLWQHWPFLYHNPGALPPDQLIFAAGLLAAVEGKDGSPVRPEAAGGKGRASWADGGVPRTCNSRPWRPRTPSPCRNRPGS